MENIVFLGIMMLCGIIFTGIGIFAWRREKPMWFWSGTTVQEMEIKNIPAYNRANGIMWIVYSIPFWISAVTGSHFEGVSKALVVAACTIGIPILIVSYQKIYRKYKR